MPSLSTLPTSFSYSHSAKSLRDAKVPLSEKLQVCNTLLTHFHLLTPPPTALLLSHLTQALSQTPTSQHFTLLHKLLTLSKTPFPSTLLPSLTSHLPNHHTNILPLLPFISNSLPNSPLPTQTAFICNLLKHAPPTDLIHDILRTHTLYISNLRNRATAFSAAVALLPALFTTSPLRIHLNALNSSLFSSEPRSVAPFLIALNDTPPVHWPYAAQHILTQSIRTSSTATSQPKRQKGEHVAKPALRMLDILLAHFSELLQQQDAKYALQAMTKVLQVTHEAGIYRPQHTDDVQMEEQEQEQAIKLAAMTWRQPQIASRLRKLTRDVCLKTEVTVAMQTFGAICTIGLEDVEQDVPHVLRECEGDDAREVLINELCKEYSRRRNLQGLFQRFGEVAELYGGVWIREGVKRGLAEGIWNMPRGLAKECVKELRGHAGIFLGALVVETAPAGECAEVFEEVAVTGEGEEVKCAALYLLASGYFARCRGGSVKGRERELVTKGGGILLGDRVDDVFKAVRDMTREGVSSARLYCVIRLVCVLVHVVLQEGGDVDEMTAFVFEAFEELDGKNDVGRLFHAGDPNRSALNCLGSILASAKKVNGKFVGMALVEGWEEIVEYPVVRECIVAGVKWIIGNRSCGHCVNARGFEICMRVPELKGVADEVLKVIKKMCCEDAKEKAARLVIRSGRAAGSVTKYLKGNDLLIIGEGAIEEWTLGMLLSNLEWALKKSTGIEEKAWHVLQTKLKEVERVELDDVEGILGVRRMIQDVDGVEMVNRSLDAILERVLEGAIEEAVDKVKKGITVGGILVKACGIRNLRERLFAQAVEFVSDAEPYARTVGINVICALGSGGGVGEIVVELLQDTTELYVETANMREVRNVMQRIGGKVIIGAALLLGGERLNEYDESGMFVRFKDVRKRRDLSNVDIDRDVGFQVAVSSLYMAGEMLHMTYDIEELVESVLQSALHAIQAAHLVIERRGTNRLAGAQVQELLIELTGLTHSIAQLPKQAEQCRVALAYVCKSLVHHHGAGVRWPVSRLLNVLMLAEGLTEEVAKSLSTVYEELGKRDDMVVKAVLRDACQSIGAVGDRGVREVLLGGVAKLMASGTAGLGGGEGVKEVRERFVKEFQYRGK